MNTNPLDWAERLWYVGEQRCDYCHEVRECAGLARPQYGGDDPDACICENCARECQ